MSYGPPKPVRADEVQAPAAPTAWSPLADATATDLADELRVARAALATAHADRDRWKAEAIAGRTDVATLTAKLTEAQAAVAWQSKQVSVADVVNGRISRHLAALTHEYQSSGGYDGRGRPICGRTIGLTRCTGTEEDAVHQTITRIMASLTPPSDPPDVPATATADKPPPCDDPDCPAVYCTQRRAEAEIVPITAEHATPGVFIVSALRTTLAAGWESSGPVRHGGPGGHRFYIGCALCQGDVDALTDAIGAALADAGYQVAAAVDESEDPGAHALRDAAAAWDDGEPEGPVGRFLRARADRIGGGS